MKATVRQTLKFSAWGWPEAFVLKGKTYKCKKADNLPDHDYFLLTKEAGREDWVPVMAADVMLVHEVNDDA
jgi:hypothetical protein